MQAAIAALHARAPRPQDTDWGEIDLLYGTLERMQPSPVVTLNRAVAAAKVRGPKAALAMIEPLAAKLDGYFYSTVPRAPSCSSSSATRRPASPSIGRSRSPISPGRGRAYPPTT